MRPGIIVSIVLGLCAGSCAAGGLGVVQPGATPELWITPAAMHLRQELAVPLTPGCNTLQMDTAAAPADLASLQLRVLEPASGVTVQGWRSSASAPGQVLWLVQAERAVTARLLLGYELKSVQAEIVYSLLLDPATRQATLQGTLTVRNTSKLDLPQVALVLPQGRRVKTTLAAGGAAQQKVMELAGVPYELTYLYDYTRYKDIVRTLLRLPAQEQRPALPAGKLRVFAAGGAAPVFVAETPLPPVPTGEEVQLDLGAAPEVTVLRNRLRSEQVNVRTDVYRKLALYDLEEETELEMTNHRSQPVTLTIVERVAGDWQVTRSSDKWQQVEAGAFEYTLPLAAGEKRKLTFVVKRLNVEP